MTIKAVVVRSGSVEQRHGFFIHSCIQVEVQVLPRVVIDASFHRCGSPGDCVYQFNRSQIQFMFGEFNVRIAQFVEYPGEI